MSLIEGFASYKPPEDIPLPVDHTIVGMPPGTRLYRIVRLSHAWQAWIATNDFINGTYLILQDNGRVDNVTSRADEGDEVFMVRPSDYNIRNKE